LLFHHHDLAVIATGADAGVNPASMDDIVNETFFLRKSLRKALAFAVPKHHTFGMFSAMIRHCIARISDDHLSQSRSPDYQSTLTG